MTIIEPGTDAKTEAADAVEPLASREEVPQVEVLVEEISIDGMCGVY